MGGLVRISCPARLRFRWPPFCRLVQLGIRGLIYLPEPLIYLCPFSDTLELCLSHGLLNCPDESQCKKRDVVRARVGYGLEVHVVTAERRP